ncbi:MAG: hypothetical protein ACR2RF_15870 [Geminicoccaceae bacterium]
MAKVDQRQVNRHRFPLCSGVNAKVVRLCVELPFDNKPFENSELEISLIGMIDFLRGRHLPTHALAFKGKA